ncbi:MAG TPA: hypothetical protein VL485_08095 [Ktedonobacteraceae bacterium]|nr:hypothetical protein [Ktedonobacteraceae bacterium]
MLSSLQKVKLHDEPACEHRADFSFETVARAADGASDHVYAVVRWGFRVNDVASGQITNEYVNFGRTTSATFEKALDNFNTYYGNP